jgi:hypothetical protein
VAFPVLGVNAQTRNMDADRYRTSGNGWPQRHTCGRRRVGEGGRTLAPAARGRDDWMVIYGNDAHRPGDFELAVFGEHAMAGTRGASVIAELAPSPAT